MNPKSHTCVTREGVGCPLCRCLSAEAGGIEFFRHLRTTEDGAAAYVDYKLLKQLIKRGEAIAVPEFRDALEAEMVKAPSPPRHFHTQQV